MLQINQDKEFCFWDKEYSKQRNFNEAKNSSKHLYLARKNAAD